MKTLQFIGISGKISTSNYKSIVISKYSIQPYPPTIHFVMANKSKRTESVDLHKMYSVSDYDFIYFTAHAECVISYELL